jgi:hypothetical protein
MLFLIVAKWCVDLPRIPALYCELKCDFEKKASQFYGKYSRDGLGKISHEACPSKDKTVHVNTEIEGEHRTKEWSWRD